MPQQQEDETRDLLSALRQLRDRMQLFVAPMSGPSGQVVHGWVAALDTILQGAKGELCAAGKHQIDPGYPCPECAKEPDERKEPPIPCLCTVVTGGHVAVNPRCPVHVATRSAERERR